MYVILGYRATLILPKNILLFAKILFFFDKIYPQGSRKGEIA